MISSNFLYALNIKCNNFKIFQISQNESQESHLYDQIVLLKIQLQEALETVQKYKLLYENSQNDLSSLKQKISHFVNDDQLTAMSGIKVTKWSDSTIQKSIALKLFGGSRVLDFSRKYIVPVVAPSTLYEIIRNLPFQPGILKFNINVLKLMTDHLEEHDLHADIKIDEKSLIPGRTYDASTSSYIGEITLQQSSELATNVLAFLLTLITVRIKILVAYQFTGSSFDGDAVKKFLYQVIKDVESNSKVKVDAITMDMGPSNCSLTNSMGISTKKMSQQFYVQHPEDSKRKLRVIFDAVHHLKNLASGLRKHNVEIDKKYVEEFNLSTKFARFSEIQSLFKKQSAMIYKPCPTLKQEVITPSHFETMRESTATSLFSSDVSSALDFIKVSSSIEEILKDNSVDKIEYTITGTSWLLKFLNHYSTLLTKTIWTKENFNEHANWLHFAISVFESLKFEKAYKKCTTGAVIGILSVLDLIKELLGQGAKEINAEYLTNNAIENYFSQIVHFSPKPSAYSFTQAAKSLSMSCYMQDPINTKNYKFSHGNISTCSNFLQLLKSNAFQNSDYRTEDVNDNIELQMPDVVSWEALFTSKLELNAFICAVTALTEKFVKSLKCDNCKSRFFLCSQDLRMDNILNRLRSSSVWELPPEIIDFFLSLEFLYRCLNQCLSPSNPTFTREFLNNAIAQSDFVFEHCERTTHKLLSTFVTFRAKMELHGRFMHKRNIFSSRCN